MNPLSTPTHLPLTPRYTPGERAALTVQARQRALQARREAADAFWSAVAAGVARLWMHRASLRPLEA